MCATPSNQVQEDAENWLRESNEERPHDSLGRVPPPDLPEEARHHPGVESRAACLTGSVRKDCEETGGARKRPVAVSIGRIFEGD